VFAYYHFVRAALVGPSALASSENRSALMACGSRDENELLIEGYPPNTLQRAGWDKGALRVGRRVTVSGWHARDESLKIFCGREVTSEDGSIRVFGSGGGTEGGSRAGQGWNCGGNSNWENWIPSIAD
jgi:hypothetical protein